MGVKIKRIEDYYEQLYAKYPQMSKKDIQKIVKYGWRQFYLLNAIGADFIIEDKKICCLVGKMFHDGKKIRSQYIKKLSVKLRCMYRRNKIQWDNYYYFIIDNNQEDTTSIFYKIYDEAKLKCYRCGKLYKIKSDTDYGFCKRIYNINLDEAEFVEDVAPLKFKDIKISNHKYEFL